MKNTSIPRTSTKKVFVLILAILAPSSLFAADVSLAWDANSETDLAGYRIYYGTSSRSYGSPVTLGKVTTYTVQSLSSGTYFFTVTAFNSSGAESGYSNEVTTTIAPTDTTPPVYVAISAGSITSTGAIVTWTTNELSDSQVEYGITPGFGISTVLNTALVTSHAQSLTGLSPNTLYYYRAKSSDAAGNSSYSGSFTFTTAAIRSACDLNADAITNVLDIQLLINVILGTTPNPGNCDLNLDGRVDVLDLQLLSNVVLGVRTCS
jgi:predicted phage tail protein